MRTRAIERDRRNSGIGTNRWLEAGDDPVRFAPGHTTGQNDR